MKLENAEIAGLLVREHQLASYEAVAHMRIQLARLRISLPYEAQAWSETFVRERAVDTIQAQLENVYGSALRLYVSTMERSLTVATPQSVQAAAQSLTAHSEFPHHVREIIQEIKTAEVIQKKKDRLGLLFSAWPFFFVLSISGFPGLWPIGFAISSVVLGSLAGRHQTRKSEKRARNIQQETQRQLKEILGEHTESTCKEHLRETMEQLYHELVNNTLHHENISVDEYSISISREYQNLVRMRDTTIYDVGVSYHNYIHRLGDILATTKAPPFRKSLLYFFCRKKSRAAIQEYYQGLIEKEAARAHADFLLSFRHQETAGRQDVVTMPLDKDAVETFQRLSFQPTNLSYLPPLPKVGLLSRLKQVAKGFLVGGPVESVAGLWNVISSEHHWIRMNRKMWAAFIAFGLATILANDLFVSDLRLIAMIILPILTIVGLVLSIHQSLADFHTKTRTHLQWNLQRGTTEQLGEFSRTIIQDYRQRAKNIEPY